MFPSALMRRGGQCAFWRYLTHAHFLRTYPSLDCERYWSRTPYAFHNWSTQWNSSGTRISAKACSRSAA